MSSETFFVWGPAYSIGLNEIDEQHRKLFDIMNELWMAIVRRAEHTEMDHILADLERYTLSHFTAEEEFMRSTEFPNLDEHKIQHQIFVDRIAEARNAVGRGEVVSLQLLHFLKDWLVSHIQVKDRAYANEFEATKTPARPPSLLGRFFSRFR